MADRREPVRDHEHGAPREQPIDGLLHEPLGLRVERRRGFVEDEHRRVGKERPRDRNALALAAREPGPALAQDRVIARRQLPG